MIACIFECLLFSPPSEVPCGTLTALGRSCNVSGVLKRYTHDQCYGLYLQCADGGEEYLTCSL